MLWWLGQKRCQVFWTGKIEPPVFFLAMVLVQRFFPNKDPVRNLLGFYCGADGSNPSLLCQPGGGLRSPASLDSVQNRQHYLKMNGREIFKSAVRVMDRASRHILEQTGYQVEDLDLVIPHQANVRIVESLSQRMGLPMEKFFVTLINMETHLQPQYQSLLV